MIIRQHCRAARFRTVEQFRTRGHELPRTGPRDLRHPFECEDNLRTQRFAKLGPYPRLGLRRRRTLGDIAQPVAVNSLLENLELPYLGPPLDQADEVVRRKHAPVSHPKEIDCAAGDSADERQRSAASAVAWRSDGV